MQMIFSVIKTLSRNNEVKTGISVNIHICICFISSPITQVIQNVCLGGGRFVGNPGLCVYMYEYVLFLKYNILWNKLDSLWGLDTSMSRKSSLVMSFTKQGFSWFGFIWFHIPYSKAGWWELLDVHWLPGILFANINLDTGYVP